MTKRPTKPTIWITLVVDEIIDQETMMVTVSEIQTDDGQFEVDNVEYTLGLCEVAPGSCTNYLEAVENEDLELEVYLSASEFL